jgi:mono/diheme cytochrome c family protein
MVRGSLRLSSMLPQPSDLLSVVLQALAMSLLIVRAITPGQAGTQAGYYTSAQAEAGKDVFDQVCAICHGDHLQGGAGPALAGEQFLSVSQFQKVDAGYFYRFMSTHMPLNAPGSLSKTQYLDILAYLLAVNGYPSGSRELTTSNDELNGIKIEPQH